MNENGDVSVQQGVTIASNGTASHVFMRESDHPTAGDSDVDISCTDGTSGVTNGGKLGVLAVGLSVNAGNNDIDITAQKTYLRNTVHIDVAGDSGSSLFIDGSKNIDN